ncbi:MAG: hypothetical protein PHN61_15375 [Methanothrix sp.]|nr:hypothetical protein [Methanothrix sp.]
MPNIRRTYRLPVSPLILVRCLRTRGYSWTAGRMPKGVSVRVGRRRGPDLDGLRHPSGREGEAESLGGPGRTEIS